MGVNISRVQRVCVVSSEEHGAPRIPISIVPAPQSTVSSSWVTPRETDGTTHRRMKSADIGYAYGNNCNQRRTRRSAQVSPIPPCAQQSSSSSSQFYTRIPCMLKGWPENFENRSWYTELLEDYRDPVTGKVKNNNHPWKKFVRKCKSCLSMSTLLSSSDQTNNTMTITTSNNNNDMDIITTTTTTTTTRTQVIRTTKNKRRGSVTTLCPSGPSSRANSFHSAHSGTSPPRSPTTEFYASTPLEPHYQHHHHELFTTQPQKLSRSASTNFVHNNLLPPEELSRHSSARSISDQLRLREEKVNRLLHLDQEECSFTSTSSNSDNYMYYPTNNNNMETAIKTTTTTTSPRRNLSNKLNISITQQYVGAGEGNTGCDIYSNNYMEYSDEDEDEDDESVANSYNLSTPQSRRSSIDSVAADLYNNDYGGGGGGGGGAATTLEVHLVHRSSSSSSSSSSSNMMMNKNNQMMMKNNRSGSSLSVPPPPR